MMQIKNHSFVKRIVFVTVLFLTTSFLANAQVVAENELFVVEMTDGNVHTIQLSEKPKVVYDGRSLNVSSADGSFSKDYLFKNIRKFYYQAVNKPIVVSGGDNNGVSKTFVVDASALKEEATSVDDAVESIGNVLSFRFVDGENVIISGVNENTTVSVYSTNGMRVEASILRNADVVNVSLSGLQPGIYIIKVGIETFKVRVK